MNKKFTFILLITMVSLLIIISTVSLLLFKPLSQPVSTNGLTEATSSRTAGPTGTNRSTEGTESMDSAVVKAAVDSCISDIQRQIGETHYKKAQELLDSALKEYPDDTGLIDLAVRTDSLEKNPVLYKGPIYHVFFHSLIVYPELCFTGDSMEQGYNNWMTTAKEFKLMLQEMYQRGYTLVDLRELFRKDSGGKMALQDVYLPEGQKPLVISVDDMSYYKYMAKDGFAKKLVLDEKGNLASLIDTPEGKEIISPDGDVVPIVENFVAGNPDFSYKGAKGTLALTGYEGILGYRTNHNNPSWEKEKENVIPVVNKLKETGWAFASHSYTHRQSFSEGTITLDYLKYDTQKWKEEVGSILGPTNLYIAPFGATFGQKDARMRYIVGQGFDVYCGVGPKPEYILYKDNAYMERIDLDGYKMYHMPEVMKDLFDVSKVFDPARPSFK